MGTMVMRAMVGNRAVLRAVFGVLVAVVAAPTTPATAQDVREVFAKVSPSVVVIRGRGRDVGVNGRGLTFFTEIGSGVVISADGDVMTAAHIVQAMDEIAVELTRWPESPPNGM